MDALPRRQPTPPRPEARPDTAARPAKRPAAALLPAFEPQASPPGLPRPPKRGGSGGGRAQCPTPVPSSSTGLLSSSPARAARAPLSAVPAVQLPATGETVTLGRSSQASQLQLSANRLVSRVHVRARVEAGARVEIECCGWNGLTLHCQGRSWELRRGDSFTSDTEGADVLVDVLDARVLMQWPRPADDEPASPPLRRAARVMASPESPTPARGPAIDIYEDEQEPERQPEPEPERTGDAGSAADDSDDADDSDEEHDEENDPVIHSFGPFGANIAGRLAAITTAEPPPPPPRAALRAAELANHVVNQLAFSRLSSTPLSTLAFNLPASAAVPRDALRAAVEATPCVGIIRRQGSDASGQPLESEYYYVPERDDDDQRRAAVDGLRRPSLRNCRKQHKQYYWKRPRTP